VLLLSIKRLADGGDAGACMVLGLCLYEGWGTKTDEQLGKQYLVHASRLLPMAKYILARLLLVKPDSAQEGMHLALQLAGSGFAPAATLLGDAYKLGLGVAKDDDESFKWYLKGGDMGDGAGYAQIGLRYIDDKGHISAPTEAKPWFEKAVHLNYLSVTTYLAKILMECTEPPNIESGMQLLQTAANQNDFGSLMKLGRIYSDGLFGVIRDETLAAKYRRMAEGVLREQGNP
jgi:TPR repeat protein